MLYIKLKVIERTTIYKQTLYPYTHSRPLGWSKVLFSEGGLVAYQIKKNEALNKMQALILTVCTPCYFGLSIKVNYRNVAFKYTFIALAF